jgi:hypothetical protein
LLKSLLGHFLDFPDRKRAVLAGLLLAVGPEFCDDGLDVTLGRLLDGRQHGHGLAASGDGDGLALLDLA